MKPSDFARKYPSFIPLSQSIGNFITCARHLNMKGLNEVKKQIVLDVRECKAQGMTWEIFRDFLEEIANQVVPQDQLMKIIQTTFEEENEQSNG